MTNPHPLRVHRIQDLIIILILQCNRIIRPQVRHFRLPLLSGMEVILEIMGCLHPTMLVLGGTDRSGHTGVLINRLYRITWGPRG